jgi:hypothetical protein
MNSDLTSFDKIEQKIGGSRKISNYIIGGMLTIGGIGFLLASISSYTGRDLLPLGNPSTLLFIPQPPRVSPNQGALCEEGRDAGRARNAAILREARRVRHRGARAHRPAEGRLREGGDDGCEADEPLVP